MSHWLAERTRIISYLECINLLNHFNAIQRNHDEKPAALDGISSQQLHAHMLRFKSFDRNLSLQPVIDKKTQFELKIEDLQFERVSQPQQFMKELER